MFSYKLFFVRISVFAYKIMVTVLASISVDVVFIPRQLKSGMFIVLSHWNNSTEANMSIFHFDTLTWLRVN
jgi:hypothetical protein